MNESLSYAEALKILGAGPSRLTTFLDTVASIGLSAWAASTTISGGDIGIPLGLYELKGDIADHGRRYHPQDIGMAKRPISLR